MTVRNFTHEYLLSREEVWARIKQLLKSGWTYRAITELFKFSDIHSMHKRVFDDNSISDGKRIQYSFILKRIERGEIYLQDNGPNKRKTIVFRKPGDPLPPQQRKIHISLPMMKGFNNGKTQGNE